MPRSLVCRLQWIGQSSGMVVVPLCRCETAAPAGGGPLARLTSWPPRQETTAPLEVVVSERLFLELLLPLYRLGCLRMHSGTGDSKCGFPFTHSASSFQKRQIRFCRLFISNLEAKLSNGGQRIQKCPAEFPQLKQLVVYRIGSNESGYLHSAVAYL
jgi:hypothetical protein